jgi:catechol 2,3-dioxygenase-like lactoylglutathione lyase family enzyme
MGCVSSVLGMAKPSESGGAAFSLVRERPLISICRLEVALHVASVTGPTHLRAKILRDPARHPRTDKSTRPAVVLAHMHPKTEGILESSLYVNDVARSARFYEKIFGFRVISDFGERGCAMEAGTHQVLLLFAKSASRAIQTLHYGDGELHLAFAIRAEELTTWEDWLAENGISVEEKRTWELAGQSIYFRDPDRHLIEIATPGVWSIY